MQSAIRSRPVTIAIPSIHNPPGRACNIAPGVRAWNCAGPRAASTMVPATPHEAPCAHSESADESGA
eukprot:2560511-Alexandrium_andersonii.AAC.1